MANEIVQQLYLRSQQQQQQQQQQQSGGTASSSTTALTQEELLKIKSLLELKVNRHDAHCFVICLV